MVTQFLSSMCPSPVQVHHQGTQKGLGIWGNIAEYKVLEGVVMATKSVRQKSLLPPSRQSRPFLMAWAQPSPSHSDSEGQRGLCHTHPLSFGSDSTDKLQRHSLSLGLSFPICEAVGKALKAGGPSVSLPVQEKPSLVRFP